MVPDLWTWPGRQYTFPPKANNLWRIVELEHDFRGFALSWVGGHSREENIIHQEGQEAESRVGRRKKGEDPRMFALWASSFILPMAQCCPHLS